MNRFIRILYKLQSVMLLHNFGINPKSRFNIPLFTKSISFHVISPELGNMVVLAGKINYPMIFFLSQTIKY